MGIKFSYVLPSDFGENVFYFTNSHVGIQPYFTNHGRCLWSLDPASKKHDQSLDGSLHGKSSQTTKLVAKSDQNHQKGYGWKPNKIRGYDTPSINWWFGFHKHPQKLQNWALLKNAVAEEICEKILFTGCKVVSPRYRIEALQLLPTN